MMYDGIFIFLLGGCVGVVLAVYIHMKTQDKNLEKIHSCIFSITTMLDQQAKDLAKVNAVLLRKIYICEAIIKEHLPLNKEYKNDN